MSYELFRNKIYCDGMEQFDRDTLDKFISLMDMAAEEFTFEKKSTDLIVRDGVPEVLKNYIAAKVVAHISTSTVKNYYSILRNMFDVLRIPVEKITANNIRVYLNYLQQLKNNSASTADGKRVVINDFFQWCVDEGAIQKNPCLRVDPIKYSDNIREPLTSIELAKVRASCETTREKALVEFLFSTGCRIAEVADMKLDDVDLENKTVIIQHGKGDKKRKSYLNASSLVALQQYLGSRNDNCEYLFVDSRGKSEKHGVHSAALRHEIERIAKRAGIEKSITPHNFRHTTGSYCSQSGMPIEQIQQLLGHASIRTTRRYISVNDNDVRNNHWRYM